CERDLARSLPKFRDGVEGVNQGDVRKPFDEFPLELRACGSGRGAFDCADEELRRGFERSRAEEDGRAGEVRQWGVAPLYATDAGDFGFDALTQKVEDQLVVEAQLEVAGITLLD